MNSSRRDFLLRTGLVSVGGTGLLLSACGGGGSFGDDGLTADSMLLADYKREMVSVNGQFKMGRTEVTVSMWREYCAATNQSMPTNPEWGHRNDFPIVDVSWNRCKEYADWAGLRLPTGAEWELAATGGDGRKYPWGDVWDPAKCINGVSNPREVGLLTAGNSPFACCDMAGNVWEWCANSYDGREEMEVRGGCWSDTNTQVFECSMNSGVLPDRGRSVIGFRLAGPI